MKPINTKKAVWYKNRNRTSHNLESSSKQRSLFPRCLHLQRPHSRKMSAVATALLHLHSMSPSSLLPARALCDWHFVIMSQLNAQWEAAILAHHPQGGEYESALFMKCLLSNCSIEATINWRELVTVTSSFFGSCNNLPCCHCQHARSYLTGILTTGTYPYSRRKWNWAVSNKNCTKSCEKS
jgi:hypothetical protein